jgi:hypothetical protein
MQAAPKPLTGIHLYAPNGGESGLDRLESTLFALMILSRIADRRRRRRFAPSLTRSSTRTTSIQAIKAAHRSGKICIGPTYRACADSPHMAMIAAVFQRVHFVRLLP